MRNLISIFILIFTIILQKSVTQTVGSNVHYLDYNDDYHFNSQSRRKELHVFCYEGKPKSILHIWQSVILQINHSTENYNQYNGNTPDEVRSEYMDQKYSWTPSLFSSKSKNIRLNPFNDSCLGIESADKYTVQLKIIAVNLWNLLNLAIGILLYLSASALSKNTVFHLVCGVLFGICTSFLILVYFISKLFPRKTLMFGTITIGSSIVIYLLQMIWDNIKVIMSTYRIYVLWYVVVTGLISFILCYRYGPVENKRTMNIIKWTLQVFGLTFIFFSSHFQEAAIGQIIFLILATHFPQKWIKAPKSYWRKAFPPKMKPITNDEYYEQGIRETAKALEELRQYCSSPECNQWKTALKIKDVKRFASFIEGSSHLSDEEILEYETSVRDFSEDEFSEEISDDE